MWNENALLQDLWYNVIRLCRENQKTMNKGFFPEKLPNTWKHTDLPFLEAVWEVIEREYDDGLLMPQLKGVTAHIEKLKESAPPASTVISFTNIGKIVLGTDRSPGRIPT